MIAYFDCYSGISGDMTVGALLDAGLALDDLAAAVQALGLPEGSYRLEAERVTRNGIAGTQFRVIAREEGEPHRGLTTILQLIAESSLPEPVKQTSSAVFRKLGEAEAQIHNTSVDEIHFHEVGGIDAIVDIVGACYGLFKLGVERVYASALPSGGGMVRAAHGPLPVPAPATLALLASAGATLIPTPNPPSIRQTQGNHDHHSHDHPQVADPARTELVTPTGAAILATLATFEQPRIRLRRIGYGFGTKHLPWANAVRLWLGELAQAGQTPSASPISEDIEVDRVVVLETNIDSMSGELLAAALERLMAAGALDVSFTPIVMKKGRPAVALTVIAPLERGEELAARVLTETNSIGLRYQEVERRKARRWIAEVETPYGTARVKLHQVLGHRTATPEYEDCRRLADAHQVPVADVYMAVQTAAGELV